MPHPQSGCPLCGRVLGEGARSLMVCKPCSDGMDRLHRVVSSTGEYAAMNEADVLAAAAALAPDRRAAPGKRCSGCMKATHEVKKLLEAPGLIICNECVALCADILDSELGQGWR